MQHHWCSTVSCDTFPTIEELFQCLKEFYNKVAKYLLKMACNLTAICKIIFYNDTHCRKQNTFGSKIWQFHAALNFYLIFILNSSARTAFGNQHDFKLFCYREEIKTKTNYKKIKFHYHQDTFKGRFYNRKTL